MSSNEKRKGLVQVYTGEGKGKTTAALGLALRAAGRGWRVKVFQFLKPPRSSGEHFAALKLAPDLEIIAVGRQGFIFKKPPHKKDVNLAREGLRRAEEALVSGRVDLLVLDEINVALSLGLVQVEAVLALLNGRPEEVEVVLTGRGAPEEILARADLVTEMKPLKHPFDRGVAAREGIEF